MKIPTFLCLLAAALPAPAATPLPAKEVSLILGGWPAPVREAVQRELRDGRLHRLKAVTTDDRTTYQADIEFPGDLDVELVLLADGQLIRKLQEFDVKSAPAAAREALLRHAGKDARLEDMAIITEGGKVTYEGEFERPGLADLKVLVAADGTLISQEEEVED